MSKTTQNVLNEDLIKAEIVTADDLDFLDTLRIPYNGDGDLWHRKHALDAKIFRAISDGVVSVVETNNSFIAPRVYTISDDLGFGCTGMKSMVDGKMYDSKSAYYKSLKEKGVVIHEAGCEPKKPQENSRREDDKLRRQISENMDMLASR